MNRRSENMSPGKDEDFEWDPVETTATAWSTSYSRKPRRAYGRRGSKKNGDAKRRTSYRRRQYQETSPEEGSNSTEREPGSSSSSLELKRCETMPIPPPPGPLGRSKSASAAALSASVPNRPPFLRHSRSMSYRAESRRDSSSTSSSLSSGDSRFATENAQPNIHIASQSQAPNSSSLLSPRQPTKLKKLDTTPSDMETKGSARKKMRNRHYDNDVSDCSPSFLSPNNHSFSLLAKSAELASSWIKAPVLSPGLKNKIGLDFCLGGDVNTTSSPTYSVATTGSSRKRGVCELPFDDAEESSLNGGQSFLSTSSFETKSRSRSRVFSTGSFSKSIMSDDAPDPSDLFARSSNDDADSHDGMTDDDSSSSVESEDSSVSDAMDIEPKGQATRNQAVAPPKPVRRSSNDFQETVFGGSEKNQSKATDPLDPIKIFETMSDYEDLKFLIKALRKEKNGSGFASFGTTKTWTIAPPSAWDSRRRTTFLQWASKGLGFSLRAGGGAVTFLQTTVAAGDIVLESLEAALIAHKASNAPPKNKIPENVAILSSVDTSRPATNEPRLAAKAPPPVDGDVDMELLSGMESLGFSESNKKMEVTEMTKTSNSPLVRIVTLETSTGSTSPHPQAAASLAPTIMDISESPHHAAPRLSHEHHVGGTDLVLHLHGLSPNPSGGLPTLPMRRLSRPSASRPNQLRTSNIPFDEDDCLETPSVKRADQFWGSGSRAGRDWGHSTRCPDDIIFLLTNRLDEAFTAAGCPSSSPFDALDKIEEAAPSSCFLPASVASAAVSSAALGFDGDLESEEESDTFAEEPGDRFSIAPGVRHGRTSSVGASAFSGLNLNDLTGNDEDKQRRKRMSSFAKHRRVSLCAAVLPPVGSIPIRRQTTFVTHGPGSLSPRNDFQSRNLLVRPRFSSMLPTEIAQSPINVVCNDFSILSNVLSFFNEQELMLYSSLVSTTWADAATAAHAGLMLTSMGFSASLTSTDYSGGGELHEAGTTIVQSVSKSMERPWEYLTAQFPWACYLSDGAFKKVFKVYNSTLSASEALSVMDVENISDKTAIAAELAVSSMLSSLARRNICPNFIITRSVFTCPYEPPASHWGSSENKKPRGRSYDPREPMGKKPRKPRADKRGTFQYIRMELCRHGDAEEYIKRLPDELMSPEESRSILFQTAFALHVAGDRFSLKHYDVKLLNVFLQDAVQGDSVDAVGDVTVLRYGIGDHVFALRMPSDRAILAKLADYGTANVQASSNGKAVTIGQFTTIENTPPDYLILGDSAQQGHGHDNFGLSLCMLHLFTGHAPYEEILEDVLCPPPLKKKLRQIWVDDEYSGFNVLRTMILPDVDGEEHDETLYHTLYRYLVLFGIPEDKGSSTKGKPVWKAITQTLVGGSQSRRARTYGRNARQGAKAGPASAQFARDQKKYSLLFGSNEFIARARNTLEMMEGGMELLMQLAHFDAQKRATALDVLNSRFMASLREGPNEETHKLGENVLSFMAYSSSKDGVRK